MEKWFYMYKCRNKMRLLSIIKVIVVMIDARSEWNVKDDKLSFMNII